MPEAACVPILSLHAGGATRTKVRLKTGRIGSRRKYFIAQGGRPELKNGFDLVANYLTGGL